MLCSTPFVNFGDKFNDQTMEHMYSFRSHPSEKDN